MTTRRQAGFTLIELMISIAVGLLVLSMGLSVLVSTLTGNTSNLRYARFNQDLRGVLNTISNDLNRAGTWGIAGNVIDASQTALLTFSGTTGTVTATATDNVGNNANIFVAPLDNARLAGRTMIAMMAPSGGTSVRCQFTIGSVTGTNTLSVTVVATTDCATLPSTTANAASWTVLNPFGMVEVNDSATAGNDCILYTYDLDLDGLVDADENFGFRFDDTNGAIEATTSSGATCTGGTWNDVTDPKMVTMSAFTVSAPVNYSGTASNFTVGVREYQVTMTGALKSEAAATRTVQAAMRVRNNSLN